MGMCLDAVARASDYGKGVMTVEWQPIETAPVDGSRILINTERRGVREAKFYMGNPDDGFCFYDNMVGGGPMTIFYDATHWMPLPEPPKYFAQTVKSVKLWLLDVAVWQPNHIAVIVPVICRAV